MKDCLTIEERLLKWGYKGEVNFFLFSFFLQKWHRKQRSFIVWKNRNEIKHGSQPKTEEQIVVSSGSANFAKE
jgi:hypothetical protein